MNDKSRADARGRRASELALTAMVLGVVSAPAVLATPLGGALAGGIAIALGRRAWLRARRGATERTSVAVAAMVCGSVGVLFAITALTLFLVGGAYPWG